MNMLPYLLFHAVPRNDRRIMTLALAGSTVLALMGLVASRSLL